MDILRCNEGGLPGYDHPASIWDLVWYGRCVLPHSGHTTYLIISGYHLLYSSLYSFFPILFYSVHFEVETLATGEHTNDNQTESTFKGYNILRVDRDTEVAAEDPEGIGSHSQD